MCSEEFSITWRDHARNVVGVFGRYLDEETLVDCTIAAEGEYLKAHRLVLAACSTYFELLFRQEMKNEEVVVLEDIKFKDMKLLIAFMYDGQVALSKDRIRDFVRAAELLQIRGLPSELVQNYLREAVEKSVGVVCTKEGLALQVSHKHMRCSANSGESSCLQWEKSINRNQTGDRRPSTNMQNNLSQENVPLQSPCFLDSDPNRIHCDETDNRETADNRETRFPDVEKEPSVEPKEEVDVEDTPIWESGNENTSAETDLSSAPAGEGVQNELTPVPSTICSRRSLVTSPHVLEKESVTSIAKLSPVAGTTTSSMNTACSSSLVSNVPIELSCCAMEDSYSCVQAELTEQSICVKNEPAVRTEVISTVASLHRESVVEPMHEVWVEELQSWDGEEVITATDSVDNEETRFQDVDAAGAPDNRSAVKPNVIFKDFPSSRVVAQRNKKDVFAQVVKEETEVNDWCMGQECKSIDVIESTVHKGVESRWQSTLQVHNDNLLNEEHDMKGQEMMVETLERALGADVVVEQSETEEDDSAPLSECVSKMLGKKSHRCLKCPGVFCTVSELRMHMKNVHKKNHSKRCKVCLATYVSESDLTRHMRTHTGERPFKCEVCEKSFGDSSGFTNHKRIHTGERPFLCGVCGQSFGSSSAFTNHKRIHSNERPFQCEVCGKSFNLRSTLTSHKRIHTGERPFQCDVCEMSFSQRAGLIRHKRVHTGERPFQCGVCGKSFGDSSALTNHNLIHTGERPFQCGVCGKSFSASRALTNHKLIHTGKHPFKCEICERTFGVRGSLARHKLIHTGERSFQCNVCKRVFTRKSILTIHMRTHTGECPFQCHVCKRSFADKSNLRKHMRTHTGERPFH